MTPHTRSARGRANSTLLLASLGFFLITLDIMIVNVALGDIGRDLDADAAGLQWVVDGYTLPFAALLLLAGNTSDRIGAKRAFGWGIILFAAASTACTAAGTTEMLIASRMAQGAGAALMLPASMALIREAFSDRAERARALGIWAVGGAVAGAVGPLAGGALATIDWRLVFAINIPVSVAMLFLLRTVDRSATRPTPFDWAGQLLSIIALTTLVWGLIEGGAIGFANPLVIAALTAAALAIGAFLIVQHRGRHPMMPLPLLAPRNMRIALGIGLAFMASWFGTVFVTSLYLQQQLGLSPFIAGLAFLPSAALSVRGNTFSGRLVNRYGARIPIVSGLLLMAAGLIGLVIAAPLNSPLAVAALITLIGPGGSIAMPAATSVVLDSAPAQQAGIASAIFNTFRQVGGAVAIAVFGAFIATPAGFDVGMRISFTAAAALTAVVALSALRLTPSKT